MKKTMTLCMIFFCAAVLSACTGNADNTNTVNSSGTAVETASEENPEDHFDDAEKTVDNKAPWIQEYEYPSEFSMGDNLKTAVIQLALCYDNFDKDSVCSEEWKEIFVSRFIQNTRSSFDYLDMASGKNNGQISVDELNYIQYSLTGIELDFSSFAGDGLDRYDAASPLNHRRVHSPMLCIVQTSTERSEVGANTPLLRSRRQTPLWCLSACTGEVYLWLNNRIRL